MTNNKINRRGLMLILSSPSGAGKTTLSRLLLEGDADIILSVSATTRSPREGEKDGVDYHFMTSSVFSKMVENGKFIEHANVFENSYGTPRQLVEQTLKNGRDVLFDIDWQGTQQIKEKMGEDVVRVFILPPSIADLEKRLKTRAQDSNEVVRNRMSKAEGEITRWAEYDYVLVNNDIDSCLIKLKSILMAERHKRGRQLGLSSFVQNLLE
tara:strand:+ start:95 stop:727 length:633 start_codon:yes stop_codon:yes gene_type:complete